MFMFINIYSVLDKRVGHYGPLFIASTDSSALRTVSLSLKDNPFFDDYVLFRVGVFDDESGFIKSNDPVYVKE